MTASFDPTTKFAEAMILPALWDLLLLIDYEPDGPLEVCPRASR